MPSDTPPLTVAVSGIGACGSGFDSASAMAEKSGLLMEPAYVTPATESPPEPSLESWVVASTREALQAAKRIQPVPMERIGLLYLSVWGSIQDTVGYLESLYSDGGRFTSPRLFTRSVYSAVASQVAIELGIRGPCETLSLADMPVSRLLQRAWCLLETRRLDMVLATWADQVTESAIHLCQRAALELRYTELARYREVGGGSVTLALTRADPTRADLHLIVTERHSTVRRTFRDHCEPRLPTATGETDPPLAPAYPTDAALSFAQVILSCRMRRTPVLWEETGAAAGHGACISIRAAETDH